MSNTQATGPPTPTPCNVPDRYVLVDRYPKQMRFQYSWDAADHLRKVANIVEADGRAKWPDFRVLAIGWSNVRSSLIVALVESETAHTTMGLHRRWTYLCLDTSIMFKSHNKEEFFKAFPELKEAIP